MTSEANKRRGAPKGNQNARKHGFYSNVLDESEQLDFELATSVEGIDDDFFLNTEIKSSPTNSDFRHQNRAHKG